MRALVLTLMLSGCAHERVEAPPPPPVNWASLAPRPPGLVIRRVTATEKERQADDLYMKALAAPGFAKLGASLDEEVHFRFPNGNDVRGRDTVIKAHEQLFGAFESRNFRQTRVLLTDSAQVLEWTMVGTHTLTKKPVVIRGLTLMWTKDNGAIADLHLYFDEAVVRAQRGEGPAALATFRPDAPPRRPLEELEQQRTPDEAANVALARAQVQALEDNKESAFLANVADDVEVSTLESAQPMRGKAALRSYFLAMHNALRYLATSTENVWGVGRFVAIEYQIIGEQKGPIAWITAQKSDLVKLNTVDVIELVNGKIARVARYDNPSQILPTP